MDAAQRRLLDAAAKVVASERTIIEQYLKELGQSGEWRAFARTETLELEQALLAVVESEKDAAR